MATVTVNISSDYANSSQRAHFSVVEAFPLVSGNVMQD
jgi:hypothetical protein